MGTLAEWRTFCDGKPLITGGPPHTGPVHWSFNIVSVVSLNKLSNKQSSDHWNETAQRKCVAILMYCNRKIVIAYSYFGNFMTNPAANGQGYPIDISRLWYQIQIVNELSKWFEVTAMRLGFYRRGTRISLFNWKLFYMYKSLRFKTLHNILDNHYVWCYTQSVTNLHKLCVNIYVYIYIYVLSLYELCYRSYIQRDCHSVLAKLHPITFYRGVRGSRSKCHFVFSLVYQLCLALW